MQITDELVDYIGALAKLEILPEEKEATKNELQKIISYMDILNTVDTTGIEAMSHAFPVHNVFRKDEVCPSADRKAIVANAPAAKDGCFKVPKTVE